ncbi:MAG: hypothetical protein ACI4XW_01745 [Candidatus Spyradocola sp.]
MTAQEQLVGALIGLARAVDNNEHLITPATNAALLQALAAATPADCNAALTALQRQKRLLVPNCFDCAAPCGRTSDCDFPALLNNAPASRTARLNLLDALRTLARAQTAPPDPATCAFLYRALFALGTETYTPADLQPYITEVETLLPP